MGYNRGMLETSLPLAPELWATVPVSVHAAVVAGRSSWGKPAAEAPEGRGERLPQLSHYRHRGWVDVSGWLRASGVGLDPSTAYVTGERGRHLRAAGITHTDEQDGWSVSQDQPLHARLRFEPLTGEAVREHWQVSCDSCPRELLQRLTSAPLNGFWRELAPKLFG